MDEAAKGAMMAWGMDGIDGAAVATDDAASYTWLYGFHFDYSTDGSTGLAWLLDRVVVREAVPMDFLAVRAAGQHRPTTPPYECCLERMLRRRSWSSSGWLAGQGGIPCNALDGATWTRALNPARLLVMRMLPALTREEAGIKGWQKYTALR